MSCWAFLLKMFHLQEVPSEDYNTPGEHGKLIVSNVEHLETWINFSFLPKAELSLLHFFS